MSLIKGLPEAILPLMENLHEGYLIGMGNPLLDISANVDDSMLKKYGLSPDNAIMADEEHMPLYKELIDNFNVEYIAGGSVQNSMRVIQWILKKPKVTAYFGCVGNDHYAKILKERAVGEGVNVWYQYTDDAPTGTCAVLITNHQRSLCANLAAATKFTAEHLHEPQHQQMIDKAKFYYVSGFFLAVSPPAAQILAKRALADDKKFIINLSAPFVSEIYKKDLSELLPYVDILFGNKEEALAFSKAFDLGLTDIKAIALKMQQLPKQNENKKRVVVITQSKEPVLLVVDGHVQEIPVKPLPENKIVDTNGAGDAFTGGFIAQLLLGQPLDICVKCGLYSAREVIQTSGCSFPTEPDWSHWISDA